MAQRDYVSRGKISRKKKKAINKTLLIIIALIVILVFVVSLFLLKQKSPEIKVQVPSVETQPKSVLPSRPEEVWSYIQELETREIPIDNSPSSIEKNAQLTAEQKRILAMLEQDQQNAQKAKQVETQNVAPVVAKPTTHSTKETVTQVVEARPESVKPKIEQAIKTSSANSTTNSQTETTVKKGFGLQCGAFKNKQQAENLQARLAMAGFNSQVSSSADWNRVFIGPIGDRAAANEAQSRAKSITNCVVISM